VIRTENSKEVLDAWRLVQDVRVELLREVLSASTGEA
jgi:hypothetical protein